MYPNLLCFRLFHIGLKYIKKVSFYNIYMIILITVHNPQCLIITQNVAFEFWHFSSIFVLLKLTCLVTLFDHKLQVIKNSTKLPIFDKLLFIKNVNVARFARIV